MQGERDFPPFSDPKGTYRPKLWSSEDLAFKRYFDVFRSRGDQQLEELKKSFAMYSVVVDVNSLRCAYRGWNLHGKANKIPTIHGRTIAVSGKYKEGKTFTLKKLLKLDVPDGQTKTTGRYYSLRKLSITTNSSAN